LKTVQQELNLFKPPSFEEIIQSRNIPHLTVTFGKRLRKSWHLTVTPDNHKKLTLPYLLKDAPHEIKEAVLDWADLVKPRLRRKRQAYYHKKKKLEGTVWKYLTEKGVSFTKKRIVNPDTFLHNTKGLVYDLKELFDTINQQYFRSKIESFIRWGTYASKTSYQTYFKDQHGNRHNLITIAGVYNHPKIPEFAIKGVIFHEMLHIVIPRYKKNGRNVIHSPEFKKAERMYPFRDKWYTWERENIYKIIKSLKRKIKR
jgi:hypothetical protein